MTDQERRDESGSGRKTGDLALLARLAAGDPVAEAARQAGMSERTVYRRLGDEKFRHQLSAVRSQMLDRAIGKLADAATEAACTLRSLLGAESETARLGAARAIFDHVTKLRESQELEERVAALEAMAQHGGSRAGP